MSIIVATFYNAFNTLILLALRSSRNVRITKQKILLLVSYFVRFVYQIARRRVKFWQHGSHLKSHLPPLPNDQIVEAAATYFWAQRGSFLPSLTKVWLLVVGKEGETDRLRKKCNNWLCHFRNRYLFHLSSLDTGWVLYTVTQLSVVDDHALSYWVLD